MLMIFSQYTYPLNPGDNNIHLYISRLWNLNIQYGYILLILCLLENLISKRGLFAEPLGTGLLIL
jgi:hypothetical protein